MLPGSWTSVDLHGPQAGKRLSLEAWWHWCLQLAGHSVPLGDTHLVFSRHIDLLDVVNLQALVRRSVPQ
jgi:hypothetical protein